MTSRRALGLYSAFFLMILFPSAAHAAAGAQQFASFISITLLAQATLAFWGISGAFLLFYAARMIFEAQKEQALTDARQSFIYAFFGFCVIALGAAFANALTTTGFSGNVTTVNPELIIPGLTSISNFIITASAGVFVLIVTIAGFRMLTTQGDQAEFTKWTKVLIANAAGVVIMVLAKIVIPAIGDTGSTATIATEVAGIAIFILTIFGFACVVALIVAGIMLIVSIDESLKDKAKKTVIGTLITLAIVLALITIINTFAFPVAR